MQGSDSRFHAGLRAGVPFAAAGTLLAISFGVVAQPLMGNVAPIVMSALLFAGSAQFAATAVLAAGGSVVAAIAAGILLNLRYVPMGIALAPSLRGGPLRRALIGQGMIDFSWAAASRGGGRFDPAFMLGATAPAYPCWVLGTAAGVFAGDLIGDPAALGLDAIFPAFFLCLLVEGELRPGLPGGRRRARRPDRARPDPVHTRRGAGDRGLGRGAARAARRPSRAARGRGGAGMSEIWITIAVLAVATAAIRASGPVLLGGRELPARAQGVIALVAPALLAALIVVETVGAPEGGALELDARVLGVGAAAVALRFGASTLPVVALAALVTALARLVF